MFVKIIDVLKGVSQVVGGAVEVGIPCKGLSSKGLWDDLSLSIFF